MQLKSEADRLIIKLSDGEALLLSLQKALTASNTKALSIDFGIGMLRDFTIGFFNGREYEKKTIAQPMELVALHGIVANDSAHLHCAVAGWDHTLLGGHLFEATVNVVNEIKATALDGIEIKRELDDKTGLMLLELD